MGAELGGETWRMGEDGRSLTKPCAYHGGRGCSACGESGVKRISSWAMSPHSPLPSVDGCLHRLGSYMLRRSPSELARFLGE